MDREKFLYFSFLLLLLFSVTARSSSLDGAINGGFEKGVLDLQKLPWKREQKVNCIFQKPRVEKGATSLQMHQRDYCSNKVTDWDKTLHTRLTLDVIRVKSLQSRFKSSILSGETQTLNPLSSDSQIPLTSGARLQTLNYIVTVAIGGRNLTLVVDTGSDLTWVQCRPCRLCYAQQDPLFDPSSSPSYRPLPCNSTACSALQFDTGNTAACRNRNSSSCTYAASYGDGSYSRGELGFETLNLGNNVIDDFIFGCGRDNKGLFGGTSGLMGLSRSELSIVYQTSSVFGQVFSYCLPSIDAGGTGSLTMGTGDFSSFRNVSPISYTRMIHLPEISGFYFLNVTGISVGGVKLDVPRFGSKRDMCIIDSGTVISRLSPMIYRALKTEFEKQFSGFPTAPGYSILNTCFNLSGFQDVKVPTIRFHFEGDAELTVDAEGSFYFAKSDGSQICLAFASLADEDEIGIIGNYQQKNRRVVYDLKESRLGFAEEPCSF
ncbi:aspartyl protease family protein At5g10770-like [Momordica charantia]|uniref:Aspartyl protease family protein At5g10770-like n=1 Tax=Momordica charantia TaxID=3673 RepID=A0A6J1D9A0_MOMCH|nr:aspartyl protease family protein At5g10770-like [Momordica charantia]